MVVRTKICRGQSAHGYLRVRHIDFGQEGSVIGPSVADISGNSTTVSQGWRFIACASPLAFKRLPIGSVSVPIFLREWISLTIATRL